jgi:hypothetical protein
VHLSSIPRIAGEVASDGKLRVGPGAERLQAPLADLDLAQASRRDTIRVRRDLG